MSGLRKDPSDPLLRPCIWAVVLTTGEAVDQLHGSSVQIREYRLTDTRNNHILIHVPHAFGTGLSSLFGNGRDECKISRFCCYMYKCFFRGCWCKYPHTGCSLLRKSRGGALSLNASRYYVSLTAYARQPPTNFGRGKAGKSFPASPRLISVKSRFSCPFSTNVPQCCCEPWITTQDTAKMSVASIYPRCVSNQPAKASMPR